MIRQIKLVDHRGYTHRLRSGCHRTADLDAEIYLNFCGKALGSSASELTSMEKHHPLADKRTVAMVALCECGASTSKVAKIFQRRHSSTVSAAKKKARHREDLQEAIKVLAKRWKATISSSARKREYWS